MIKKTLSYLKRNGLAKTLPAVAERLLPAPAYKRVGISEAELIRQRSTAFERPLLFDILVPAWHTENRHFEQMITSVLEQTYGNFRLLIGDAGKEERLERIAKSYGDDRVIYIPLKENRGISENTNELLRLAKGDYIIPLDHDDFIEPNALFWIMKVLDKCQKSQRELFKVIYTDEDKCDSEGRRFYEPHYKRGYDTDLLMSNNYICHLSCIERELAHKLMYRSRFDGAQDHDLLLRACDRAGKALVFHIPKILYHWRCHKSSTASNPESKMWAYDSGRACVEDFCKSKGWAAVITHSPHLGYYEVRYEGNIFVIREDVGAVCGPVYSLGRTVSGALDLEGRPLFKGLPKGFSGYMKRAACRQGVPAGDLRNMLIRPSIRPLVKEAMKERDVIKRSLAVAGIIRNEGYRILYLPDFDENAMMRNML